MRHAAAQVQQHRRGVRTAALTAHQSAFLHFPNEQIADFQLCHALLNLVAADGDALLCQCNGFPQALKLNGGFQRAHRVHHFRGGRDFLLQLLQWQVEIAEHIGECAQRQTVGARVVLAVIQRQAGDGLCIHQRGESGCKIFRVGLNGYIRKPGKLLRFRRMYQQRMSAALAEQRCTEMLSRLVEEQLKVAVAALPGKNQKCIKILPLHFCA